MSEGRKRREQARMLRALAAGTEEGDLAAFRQQRLAGREYPSQEQLHQLRELLHCLGDIMQGAATEPWARLSDALALLQSEQGASEKQAQPNGGDAAAAFADSAQAASAAPSDARATATKEEPLRLDQPAPTSPELADANPSDELVAKIAPAAGVAAVVPVVVAAKAAASPVAPASMPAVEAPAEQGEADASPSSEGATYDGIEPLPADHVMPFRGSNEAPATATGSLEPLPQMGATAPTSGWGATSPAIPFGDDASDLELPSYTVEQYASLQAELMVRPTQVKEVLQKFHLPNMRAKRALERQWADKLKTDDALRQHYDGLVAQYKQWLAASSR